MFLGPECTVQRAVLNAFGNVFGLNCLFAFEISDSPGDFEYAVIGTRGESLLGHGAFEQAFAIWREFAESADVAGRHLSFENTLPGGTPAKRFN